MAASIKGVFEGQRASRRRRRQGGRASRTRRALAPSLAKAQWWKRLKPEGFGKCGSAPPSKAAMASRQRPSATARNKSEAIQGSDR